MSQYEFCYGLGYDANLVYQNYTHFTNIFVVDFSCHKYISLITLWHKFWISVTIYVLKNYSFITILAIFCSKLCVTVNFCPILKSRIRETPTLLACADSSTNTMKSRLFDTFLHFWPVISQFFAFFGTFCDFSGTL